MKFALTPNGDIVTISGNGDTSYDIISDTEAASILNIDAGLDVVAEFYERLAQEQSDFQAAIVEEIKQEKISE